MRSITFHSTATRSIFASTVSASLAVFGERCGLFALSTCTSTSHPPRLYGRTFTLIALTSSATAHARNTLAGPPDERGGDVRARRWAGACRDGGGPPGPWVSCRAAQRPLRTSGEASQRC